MRRKISQRDARRYRDRVKELENVLKGQRAKWSADWPGGIHVWTEKDQNAETMATFRTARKLGHAVVAVADHDTAVIRFYAVNPDNP